MPEYRYFYWLILFEDFVLLRKSHFLIECFFSARPFVFLVRNNAYGLLGEYYKYT